MALAMRMPDGGVGEASMASSTGGPGFSQGRLLWVPFLKVHLYKGFSPSYLRGFSPVLFKQLQLRPCLNLCLLF